MCDFLSSSDRQRGASKEMKNENKLKGQNDKTQCRDLATLTGKQCDHV
jgi:hypothetical protein